MLYLVLVIIAPLPLALTLVLLAAAGSARPIGWPGTLQISAFVWFVVQTSAVLCLAALRALNATAVITAQLVALVVGSLVLATVRRRVRSLPVFPPLNPVRLRAGAIVASMLFVFMAVQLWIIATSAITDWDSLEYHLPFMAMMYQTGRPAMIDHFDYTVVSEQVIDSGDALRWGEIGFYPYSWEALGLLFVFSSGDVSAAALPNYFAWVVFGLTTYLIALRFGSSRLNALAASALVMGLFQVTDIINTLRVDLAFATFFAAGIWYACQFAETRLKIWLALYVLSLAMLFTTKLSAVGYGALSVLFLVAISRKPESAEHAATEPAGVSALVLAGAAAVSLFVGGFWYLRNLLEIGNPLGLVQVQLGSSVVWPGPFQPAELSRTSLANTFSVVSAAHWRILTTAAITQFGLALGPLVLATLAAVLLLLIPAWRPRIAPLAPLIALLIGLVVLHWFTPNSGSDMALAYQITPYAAEQLRFALGAFAIIGAIVAVVLTQLEVPTDGVAAIVIACLAYTLGTLAVMQAGLLLAACAALAILISREWLVRLWVWGSARWSIRVLAGALPVVLIVGLLGAGPALTSGRRTASWDKESGGVQRFLDSNAPPGATIGYSDSAKTFLFYGRRLDKHVTFILPAKTDTRQSWLQALRQKGVSYVAVGPLVESWHGGSIAVRWLEQPDGAFTRVFGTDIMQTPLVYRVN